MATITSSSRRQSATITIPAGYLEDARGALVAEIVSDSDALRVNEEEVVSGRESGPANRESSARFLRNDVELLHQLLDASSDTKVTAERDTIADALQAMVRLLAVRLQEQADFAPVDMGAVLDLSGRLRWAAEEALRIDPALDPRTVA